VNDGKDAFVSGWFAEIRADTVYRALDFFPGTVISKKFPFARIRKIESRSFNERSFSFTI
jgi:hypothetical protein